MSLKNTEEVLSNFITFNIPQVLVVKGAWGSGKTYFLEKEFLAKHRDDKNLGFKKYSYVSLFGLKNIQDIKFNLFENLIEPKQIGDDINLLDVQKNYKILGKKMVGFFRGINTVNEYSNLGWWFLNTQENTLIIIDDFERINKDLDVDEVLGLISELKEKRKCKIILVMNDEKLDSKSRENYLLFKEKVVDIEIEFKPTPQESTSIIFSNDTNQDEIDLKNLSIKLGITNIRIINKIKHFYNLVLPFLNQGNYHKDFRFQTLSSLVFLINSFYGNPNDNSTNISIPGIKFALGEDSIGSIEFLGKEETEPEFHTKWREIFRNYGWSHADEFDIELYEIIKRGYVIEEDFEKKASKINLFFIDGNKKDEYYKLWENKYHIGFIENEDDFVISFSEFYETNSKYLDISDLNTVVNIFRKISRDQDATKIIDFFIESNKDNIEKLNLDNFFNYSNYHLDNEIIEKVVKFIDMCNKEKTSIESTFNSIILKNNSVSKKDEIILFSLTEDKIYDILNSLKGDTLRQYIEILLKYKNVSNASDEWKNLTEKTINVLNRFNSSKLNKVRLEGYGYLK